LMTKPAYACESDIKMHGMDGSIFLEHALHHAPERRHPHDRVILLDNAIAAIKTRRLCNTFPSPSTRSTDQKIHGQSLSGLFHRRKRFATRESASSTILTSTGSLAEACDDSKCSRWPTKVAPTLHKTFANRRTAPATNYRQVHSQDSRWRDSGSRFQNCSPW